MNKASLRKAIRARRDAFAGALSPQQRERHAEAAAALLTPLMTRFRSIAGYAPLGSEFPVLAALKQAAARGLQTALPHVTARDEPMRFFEWRPGSALNAGWSGLSQPDESDEIIPDILLCPLTGFDRTLERIGQGAGFYDRWFAAHPHALRIGMAWSIQEEQQIPVDAWDIRLHAIVTEREWIGPPL